MNTNRNTLVAQLDPLAYHKPIEAEDKQLQAARHFVAHNPARERLHACKTLSRLLFQRYQVIRQHALLAECINVEQKIRASYPTKHPSRTLACVRLAKLLCRLYKHTGDVRLLDEATTYHTEASSQVGGYLYWSSHSAFLKRARSELTGDERLLQDAINISRVRVFDHPLRASPYIDLAISLWMLYGCTAFEPHLSEAITFFERALSLRPPKHPNRAISCVNLAVALCTKSGNTGDTSLLGDAIALFREALSCKVSIIENRSIWNANLATALWIRFQHTGDLSLLGEVVSLYEAALSCISSSASKRSVLYSNFAVILRACYEHTGNKALLDRGLELSKEALSYTSTNHPERAISLGHRANFLLFLFIRTGDSTLLDEAIGLHREALSARPNDHPDRVRLCTNLAVTLWMRYERTRNETELQEAISLNEEALRSQQSNHPKRWYAIANLIRIHLDRHSSSQHSVVHAIEYLQRMLALAVDDLPALLSEVAHVTARIHLASVPEDLHLVLLQCYSAAIDLAAHVAGFVLDRSSQLKYLAACQHLGSLAYACANSANRNQDGLRLLDRARGIIWSQSLHVRNPQLQHAPPVLASELEHLLRCISLPSQLSDELQLMDSESGWQTSLPERKHMISSRIQQLIRHIRETPGQSDFMRGPSYKQLIDTAQNHPVIVLVAAQDNCYAEIIRQQETSPICLPLGVCPTEIRAMSSGTTLDSFRGTSSAIDRADERAFKFVRADSTSHSLLGKLWISVVRPILTVLGLKVSFTSIII
jgi:hypothetical protein